MILMKFLQLNKSPVRILIFIILIAVILRLPNAGANFSGDEIDMAGPARHFVVNGDFRQFDDCNG